MMERLSSGVFGLDEILGGGYPAGSPVLVMGGPGCGKTLFLLCFAARSVEAARPTILATTTEAPDRLRRYAASMGHDLNTAEEKGALHLLDLRQAANETVSGAFDLDAVFVRLENAARKMNVDLGACCIALDEFNRLAYAFDDLGAAREPTLALLRKLRDSGATILISAGETRAVVDSLVDYAVDGVINLSQQVKNRLMTRVLRVSKLRGVAHGTNEYPFLIDGQGPSVMPVSAVSRDYNARGEIVSTGNEALDDALGGGLYRGSALMITGTSGTGKTTIAAAIVKGLCEAGLSGGYFSFEQSRHELEHDLGQLDPSFQAMFGNQRLTVDHLRAVEHGLEDHLIRTARWVGEHEPGFLVLDPISSLMDIGDPTAVKMMLVRLVDLCKLKGVLVIMTELLTDSGGGVSRLGLSSLLDAWVRLELKPEAGEHLRLMRVLKSRGAANSTQVKEFEIGAGGVRILDPYIGPGGVAFGVERLRQEQADQRAVTQRRERLEQLQRRLEALPKTYAAKETDLQWERDQQLSELREEIRSLEQDLELMDEDAADLRRRRS